MTTIDDFGNNLANWPRHPGMHVGTVINGERWCHTPGEGWQKMRPYLEPAEPRHRWRLWRRTA